MRGAEQPSSTTNRPLSAFTAARTALSRRSGRPTAVFDQVSWKFGSLSSELEWPLWARSGIGERQAHNIEDECVALAWALAAEPGVHSSGQTV